MFITALLISAAILSLTGCGDKTMTVQNSPETTEMETENVWPYPRFMIPPVPVNRVIAPVVERITEKVETQNEDLTTVKDDTFPAEFREDYEMYNGDEKYPIVSFPEGELPVAKLDETTIMDWFNDRTGILYIGFPTCPWCRNAVSSLMEVAMETGETVYTLNIREVKDETVKQDLTDKLKDFLSTDAKGEPHIYSPDVFAIRDGKPVNNHLSTVDSQENPRIPLTRAQLDELKAYYRELFSFIDKDIESPDGYINIKDMLEDKSETTIYID